MTGNEFLDIVIYAVLIGLIPATIARLRGHDFMPWWIFGSIFFIIALPMSIFKKPFKQNPVILEQEAFDEAVSNGLKKCPKCAEFVKNEAKICKHCKSEFEAVAV